MSIFRTMVQTLFGRPNDNEGDLSDLQTLASATDKRIDAAALKLDQLSSSTSELMDEFKRLFDVVAATRQGDQKQLNEVNVDEVYERVVALLQRHVPSRIQSTNGSEDYERTNLKGTPVVKAGPTASSSIVPQGQNFRKERLTPSVGTDIFMHLLSDKPYVPLQGVHVVVIPMYGPEAPPAMSTFNGNGFLSPSMWKYPRDARSDELMTEWSNSMEYELRQWYFKAVNSILAKSAKDDSLFKSMCFTINLDPIMFPTWPDDIMGQNLPESTITRQLLSEHSFSYLNGFKTFLEMLKTNFKNQDSSYDFVVSANDDIDDHSAASPSNPVNNISQQQEQKQYSIFMKQSNIARAITTENFRQATEKMSALVSSDAFRKAVHDFMSYRYEGLDSIGRVLSGNSLNLHYFVEVVGFTTPKEWKDSHHDFGMMESRRKAWGSWLRRLSNLRNEKGAMIGVYGNYIIQNKPVRPFSWSYYYRRIFSTSDFRNKLLSNPVPISFAASRGTDGSIIVFKQFNPNDSLFRPKNAKDLKYYSFDEVVAMNSSTGPLQRRRKATPLSEWMKFNDWFTSTLPLLPVAMDQLNVIPMGSDAYFYPREFDFKIFRQLGQGSYGQVIKVGYKFTGKYDLRNNKLRHHFMILDLLLSQQNLYWTYARLIANKAFVVASRYESIEPYVSRVDFRIIDSNGKYVDYSQNFSPVTPANSSNLIDSVYGCITMIRDVILQDTGNRFTRDASVQTALASIQAIYSYETHISGTGVALKFSNAASNESWRLAGEVFLMQLLTQFNEATKIVIPDALVRSANNVYITENYVTNGIVPRVRIQYEADKLTEWKNELSSKWPALKAYIQKLAEPSLSTMTSSSILHCYGSGNDSQVSFAVLPFMQNGSMDALIAKSEEALRASSTQKGSNSLSVDKKPLSLFEFVSLCSDVAGAIRYLSSVGICHGDLKHANVVVDHNFKGKVGDFGLSHSYGTPTNDFGTPAFFDRKVLSLIRFPLVPIDDYLDSYALGKIIDCSEINETFYKTYMKNPRVARYIGCFFKQSSFSRFESENGVFASEPPLNIGEVVTSGLAINVPHNSYIPKSTRILSKSTASVVCNVLNYIAASLTSPDRTKNAIDISRAINDDNDLLYDLGRFASKKSDLNYGVLAETTVLLKCLLAYMEDDVNLPTDTA